MKLHKQQKRLICIRLAFLAVVITIFAAAFTHIGSKARALEEASQRAERMQAGRARVVYETVSTAKAAAANTAQATPEPQPVFYDVPLSDEEQLAIFEACAEHEIEPEIILAVIWHESRFEPDAMGDNGRSYGLMQVQQRFHLERMERLGVTDLLDPVQNVTVGIDILAELIAYYDGNIHMALVAYQNGQTGAAERYFDKGIYSNDFSKSVFEKAGDFHVRSR